MPSTGSITQRTPELPSLEAPSSPRKLVVAAWWSVRKPVISFSEGEVHLGDHVDRAGLGRGDPQIGGAPVAQEGAPRGPRPPERGRAARPSGCRRRLGRALGSAPRALLLGPHWWGRSAPAAAGFGARAGQQPTGHTSWLGPRAPRAQRAGCSARSAAARSSTRSPHGGGEVRIGAEGRRRGGRPGPVGRLSFASVSRSQRTSMWSETKPRAPSRRPARPGLVVPPGRR